MQSDWFIVIKNWDAPRRLQGPSPSPKVQTCILNKTLAGCFSASWCFQKLKSNRRVEQAVRVPEKTYLARLCLLLQPQHPQLTSENHWNYEEIPSWRIFEQVWTRSNSGELERFGLRGLRGAEGVGVQQLADHTTLPSLARGPSEAGPGQGRLTGSQRWSRNVTRNVTRNFISIHYHTNIVYYKDANSVYSI